MTELYDKDSNLVEGALTKDEHEQQVKDAQGKAEQDTKKGAEEKDGTINRIRAERNKLRIKEHNWKEIREKKKGTEGENEELKSKVDETSAKVDGMEQKEQQRLKSVRDGAIKKLVGDDDTLEGKVRHLYKERIGGDKMTDEQVKEAARDAYLIATKDAPTGGALSGSAVSGAGGKTGGTKKPLSAEAREMGKDFGISEDVLKKHTN